MHKNFDHLQYNQQSQLVNMKKHGVIIPCSISQLRETFLYLDGSDQYRKDVYGNYCRIGYKQSYPTNRFTVGQKQRSRKFELLKYWCERNHLKQSETNIELMRMNKMLNPISKLTAGKGKLKHACFYMLYTVGVFHFAITRIVAINLSLLTTFSNGPE